MSLLYRSAELRLLEEEAGAGLPPGTLMQRAGEAAAEQIDAWLAAQAPEARGEVLILCGPGNNGGDGYTCAQALQRQGRRCLCWAPRAGHRSDALAARARWLQDGGRIVEALPDPGGVCLVVDALFGIGMARPLDEPFLGALRWAQGRALPIIALDLPSGLDADTGAWVGAVAGAPALRTITFLGDKPGLHTLEGIDAAGRLTLAPLGVAEPAAADPTAQARASGRLNEPAFFPAFLQRRRSNTNKGDFGSVGIVGGAEGMVGAVLLAGRAALHLGAGKVFVHALGAPGFDVDPLQPELMLRPAGADGRFSTPAEVLVAGCGLGTDAAARCALACALAHTGPLVVDADALNLLATDDALRGCLAARAPGTTVLTPHPGEAGRLLGVATASVQQDRVRSALALAASCAAVVVLKGAGTVIALGPERYVINPTGGPALASAGTGDVLAGMIGALLAQAARGCETRPGAAPGLVQATLAAVWLHGQAALDFGAQVGLTASAIAPLAARALARLRGDGGDAADGFSATGSLPPSSARRPAP